MTVPTVADLRSDTLTRPTPGMRAAIADAAVGDDVYGEDPEVNALEAEVAELLGHEAGLFCPTGSLSNMLGVRVLVEAGQELLCDSLAHVVRAELGGHAALAGVTTRTWRAPRGLLDPDEPLSMATPDAGPYQVSTAAIAVENTHNFGGGTVQPLAALQRLRAGAQALGVAVHMDGARLWNAHVATGVALKEYGACADTVSVCLSKGLGAPIGSVLVSTADRIARARVWRKRYGGGMRQVGVLAAAGRYALAHQLERLVQDHANAAALAARVAAEVGHLQPLVVHPEAVQTNIVVLDTRAFSVPAAELAARAARAGVLVSALGPHVLRAVTHLDVGAEAAAEAGDVLARVLGEAATA